MYKMYALTLFFLLSSSSLLLSPLLHNFLRNQTKATKIINKMHPKRAFLFLLLSVQSRSSHSFTHFHKNNIHNKKTTKLPTFQCYAKAPNNRKERINRKETTNKENDGTTTSGKHRHKAKLLSGRAVSRRKAISSAIVAAAAFNTAAYALQIESVVTDGCVIHEGVVTNIQKKKKKKKRVRRVMVLPFLY
mmetsp:Transcript_34196/g.50069  ORF Transcript_34196/g.50069 Transcript_34196/m.50069 type:complete len:190 (-) Transcript_34196:1626-2195(-)